MVVFEHSPEQLTSGASHVTSHVPELHLSPDEHAASQAPQLRRSEFRSRQLPEQSVKPPGQAAMHVPS